jgi:hypothetical protein
MPFHLCLCTEILCRLCRGIGCTWNIPALMIFSSALADKLGVHFNLWYDLCTKVISSLLLKLVQTINACLCTDCHILLCLRWF